MPAQTTFSERGKTRQGIDLELHPLFARKSPPRIRQVPALSRNDFSDLYDLRGRRSVRHRSPHRWADLSPELVAASS
jgi:hypothetical protein